MKEGEHLTVPDFDEIYADSEVNITFTNSQLIYALRLVWPTKFKSFFDLKSFSPNM